MQRQHVPHALTPGPQAGRDLKVWSVWKVTQALKSKAMVLGFRQRPRTLPSLGTARVWSGQDAKPEKADPQLTPQARHTATTLVFSLAQLKTVTGIPSMCDGLSAQGLHGSRQIANIQGRLESQSLPVLKKKNRTKHPANY